MRTVADGVVKHVGTFNANPLAAAAGVATLTYLEREGLETYARLERLGSKLADGLREAAAASGIPLLVHQVGPVLHAFVTERDRVVNYRDALVHDGETYGQFTQELLSEDVQALPRGLWFLSLVHTDPDIDETVTASDRVFSRLRLPLAAENPRLG